MSGGRRGGVPWLWLGLACAGLGCTPSTPAAPAPDGSADGALPLVDSGPLTLTLPTSIPFGLSDCGGAAPPDQTVSFTNGGESELRVSVALQAGTSFTVSPASLVVAPGASASLTMHAAPVPAGATAGKAITDTLFVTTNVPGHPSATVPVSITPRGATVTVAPASVAFGAVPVGTSATPIPVTVTNSGNASATVSFGTPTDPELSFASSAPLTIAAAGSGQISAQFTPTSLAAVQASASITVTNAAVCGTSATSLAISGNIVTDCATNHGGCDPNAACSDSGAGAVCACNPGYVGNGTTCTSDCATGNGGCDPNATCGNGDAGVVCSCVAGYTGSGVICTSLCVAGGSGCDPNAACSNGDAGILCACNPGYAGNGTTCASLCATNNGGCDPNATCSNVPAGVACACNPGFTGSGATCLSDDYQTWPPPPDAPPQSEYAVSADGTVVTDAVTQLSWQRMVFGNPCPNDANGSTTGCTWADAATYCASLDAIGAAGLGNVRGWRVPSVVELLSIVSYGDGVPTIDTSPFPATPTVPFWTHTPSSQAASTQSWTVSFATGLNATQALATVSPVRCVTSAVPAPYTPICGTAGLACCYGGSCGPGLACNGGACTLDLAFVQTVATDSPPESQYDVSDDGALATDSVTHLTWQRALAASPCPGDSPSGCTWANAQTYCGSLDSVGGTGLGGVTGWRLPSLLELLSLVNYADGVPTIDTAPFPGTPTVAFWAQTPYAINPAQSWSVSFGTGLNATQAVTTASPVRCVTSSVPGAFTPACGTMGLPCCNANGCGSGLACVAGQCATDLAFAQTIAPDVPPESASTASADGTFVTDSVTGLHWQRQLFADPCPGDGAGPGVCTWAHAQSYCASLNATGLGGISSGWRAPSLLELLSIVNYADGTPTIDTALYPSTPLASFWTQTPDSLDPTQAWSVSFGTGVNATQPETGALAVRCVSAAAPSSTTTCGVGGAACCYANSCGPALTCNASVCATDLDYAQSIAPDVPPESQYSVSPGGSVVTDGVTGLVWQRQVAANPCPSDAGAAGCSWSDAAAYCASLDGLALGGYGAGWRVPRLHELLSIVDYGDGTPTIATSPFPETPLAPFWTATPDSVVPAEAWAVTFATGLNLAQPVATSSLVRCVNSGGVAPAPEGCGALGQACCYGASCGASLACASGTCVTDANYQAWSPVAPDAPPAAQYTVAASGLTATDTVTGLVWALGAGGATPCPVDGTLACTQAHAATFCAGLNGAGFGGISSGWRLPSVVELLSIVNYAVAKAPTVDVTVFGKVIAAPYWTSTTPAGNATAAWSIDFNTGLNSLVTTSTALAPLCVSSN